MYWNMSCLAETLTPFVGVDTLRASLDRFPGLYETAYRTQMARRLALEVDNDALTDIIQAVKNVCKTPGVYYPEIFSYLLREDWVGLSRSLKGLEAFAQLRLDGHLRWARTVYQTRGLHLQLDAELLAA